MATDFAPHNMTAPDAPSPHVVSDESHIGESNAGWKCFDGADYVFISNVFHVATWIKIDLGSGNEKILGSYSVKAGSTANEAPKAWTLEGSNDNANWDVLDTVTNETAWGPNEKRDFEADVTTTAYRFFKLNITENNGFSLYTTVNEIYLYEAEEPPPSGPTQEQLLRHGTWFDSGVKQRMAWAK